MKIYVFGNPLLKEDSLPLKILPALKKLFPCIKFVVVDPNENFPPKGEKNLVILDTVIGIKEPMILDLDDFDPPAGGKKTPASPHDYDLLFHLLLLKKLGKIKKIKIIGVPKENNAKLFESINSLIKGLKDK